MKQAITIFFFLFSSLFSNDKIGYILKSNGHVSIISEESNVLNLNAIEGRYIYENDIIRSHANSSCTIIFLDRSSLFSIYDNSEISINNLTMEEKKINLNYGQVYIENSSKINPLILITPSNQINSLSNSVFIESSFNMDDIVYTFNKSLYVYNKRIDKMVFLEDNMKAIFPLSGEISAIKHNKNFLPKNIIEAVNLEQFNLKVPVGEFEYKKGDLIIGDSLGYILDVYKIPEIKKLKINMGGYVSSITNNQYGRLVFYPEYKNKNFTITSQIDQYFERGSSPSLNVWNEPIKVLAKIKKISYSDSSKDFYFDGGNINNITMGHGLLVKNYKNQLNYPLYNSHGAQFKYGSNNFINIDFFTSNLEDLLIGDGFFGLHASLFISKYLPIELGAGIAVDMNQFSGLPSRYSMMPSRNIKALEFDLTYTFYSKPNYHISFISEIGALTFADEHSYRRYNSLGDISTGMRKKSGAWGISSGVEGSYKDFLNVKTLVHYNDPLFIPSFFNNTYEMERYRLLKIKDQYTEENTEEIENMLERYHYNTHDVSSESDLTLVPKDMYLAYMNNEVNYPSSGFTIDFSYNYYNKIVGYVSYTSLYESDNSYASSEPQVLATLDLGLEIFKKVLKNIEVIKFNYSKSMSKDVFDFSDSNENTSISFSLRGKLRYGLLLDLNFERVNYDYDFNGYANNIDIVDIGLIYRIY